MQGNNCRFVLFTGQYPESSNRTCTPCRSLCKQCSPVDPDKCTSCPAGKFLHEHQCISAEQCPVGTYANTTTEACESCPVGCASCGLMSDLKCLACSEGFVLYKSECLMRCPEGTFPKNSNRLGFHNNDNNHHNSNNNYNNKFV